MLDQVKARLSALAQERNLLTDQLRKVESQRDMIIKRIVQIDGIDEELNRLIQIDDSPVGEDNETISEDK